MRKPLKSFGVAMRQGLLAAAFCVPMASAVMAAEVPWKDETFERTSFDEDIRNVLRAVLKQNGLEVVFRPGVQGAVTSTFSRIPLRGAFNKLLEENGLSYEYSDETKTITISTKEKSTSEFIPLRNLDEAMVKGVRDRFRLGGEIIYDDKTRTVMLKGDPDQVAKLKDLIGKLETAQAEMIKSHHDSEAQTTKASLTDAEAQVKTAEAQRIRDQTDAARQARLEIENITVEVLPLHYASVGSTRVKFQGEDVTIPGVIDTLNSLLGIGSAALAAQSTSARPQLIAPPTPTSQDPTVIGQAVNSNAGGGGGVSQMSEQLPIIVRKDPMSFRGTISPDTRTNSVIVRGTQREIDQVKKLLPKLDKQMEQVEIEAIIAQTSENLLQQLGLRIGNDAAIASKKAGTEIGGAVSTIGPAAGATGADRATGWNASGVPNTTPYISPMSLLPIGSAPALASFLYRGASYALTAQLNASATNGKSHVLASPRVVTLDNIAAKISTDATLYLATSAGANSSGSYISIPAGLTLKITPSILQHEDVGDDNLIRLVIEAENTTASGGLTPSRSGQQIQTQVIIPDGSTFIMGGMTSDNRTENLDHVPLISEIPILGELFKNRTSQQDLNEALFFITPRVVPHADFYNKDVAEKRYLQSQRAELERVGSNVRNDSMLLKLNTRTLEEDE